jgi:hypothetical protein
MISAAGEIFREIRTQIDDFQAIFTKMSDTCAAGERKWGNVAQNHGKSLRLGQDP